MSDAQKSGKFLRAITPKNVMTEVGVNLLALPRPVQGRVLYDLFGTVARVNQKPNDKSDKGVSTAFLGEFEAVTPEGEVFVSGKAFIPVMEDVLFSTFMSARQADDKAQIDIALRIAIKTAPDTKPSMTGYEFDVQPLVAVKSSSRIAALKALAAQGPLALAAPKAHEPPAAAAEPAVPAGKGKGK